jgi:hypothetical protein
MGNHVGARRNQRSVNSYLVIDDLRRFARLPAR